MGRGKTAGVARSSLAGSLPSCCLSVCPLRSNGADEKGFGALRDE